MGGDGEARVGGERTEDKAERNDFFLFVWLLSEAT